MKSNVSIKILFCLLTVSSVSASHANAAPVWMEPGWSISILHDKQNGLSLMSHEVYASVPGALWGDYWSSGYMEFDLRAIPSTSNLAFTLHLVDSGGLVSGDSTTTIAYYVGGASSRSLITPPPPGAPRPRSPARMPAGRRISM